MKCVYSDFSGWLNCSLLGLADLAIVCVVLVVGVVVLARVTL
jgi:hypothetical protein